MSFNSIEFFLFLPLVLAIYWWVFNKSRKLQNLLILGASYLFYGWWDWRFLSLIFISSLTDYLAGIYLERSENKRNKKLILISSLVLNLGILGFFKYFNFFVDSLVELFAAGGLEMNHSTLYIILPIGISFYTFQSLSYTIDIYRGKLKATHDIVSFFAFVSFFPQLVSGPIERGLFKKIAIADVCAVQADYVFANYEFLSAGILLIGALCFTIQIYCDFSGYSDIAIGVARLFGFNLLQNFRFPYFSRDIAEFWRRWHISLSTWFRDYVYIPLGGNSGGKITRVGTILFTFTLSGFWHGANWTFVVWGLLHGLYYLPGMLLNRHKKYAQIIAHDSLFPGFRESVHVLITFFLVLIGLVIFRSDSITAAYEFLMKMITVPVLGLPDLSVLNVIGKPAWMGMLGIVVLIVIEWIQRREEHGLVLNNVRRPVRWGIYYILGLCILYCFTVDLLYFSASRPFIYFQF